MKVVHVCNAFQTNPMYLDLFERLENNGVKQVVISPGNIETSSERKRNDIEVFYFKRSENIIKRLLWRNRIASIINYVENSIDLYDCDMIHAHTLFSDGAVAYGLYKKYKKPYIVAVRNTDLNVFFKYMLWERPLGYNILKYASKIVLISHANKKQLYKIIPQSLIKKIDFKVEIIPNGINDFWLTNINKKDIIDPTNVRLTYVGDICANKNIDGTLKAISNICKEYNVFYTVIGDNKNENNNYLKKIRKKSEIIPFFKIEERCKKEKLIHYFRNDTDIFIMNSHKETFGLSYIEALTQGLPIIYTKDQGIDGFFEEGFVGYHAKSTSIEDISNAIKKVIKEYNSLSNNIKGLNFDRFDWGKISMKYTSIYDCIYDASQC